LTQAWENPNLSKSRRIKYFRGYLIYNISKNAPYLERCRRRKVRLFKVIPIKGNHLRTWREHAQKD